MKIKSSTLYIIASAIIVFAAVAIFIYRQFSLSFGALGCLIIILGLISTFFSMILDANKSPETMREHAYLCAFGLLLCGLLSIYTLNNYLFPKSEIYKNVDHHIIKIEGLDISEPNNFLLVGDSNKALFDNEVTLGEAVVKKVTDSTVVLETHKGFMRPIYLEKYDGRKLTELSLLNAKDLVTFKNQSQLYLKTKKGKEYVFTAKYDKGPSVKKDTMRYYLNGMESDNHTFITRGMDLSSLLTGLRLDSLNVDVEGLQLVRTKIFTQTGRKDRRENYPDDEFAVVYRKRHSAEADNSVVAISSDGKSWTKIGRNPNSRVSIAKNKYCSIGYGTEKTVSFKFCGDKGKLSLRYRIPMMRYLSSDDDRPDNLVLLTQSLNLQKKGVDKNYEMLPDNIMLFDIFEHIDNVNRMSPKQLAYISGPTSDSLFVNVYDYNSASSAVQHLKAGESIKATGAIGTGNVHWNVSLCNLKSESLYQPKMMRTVIALLTLALVILLLVGSMRASDRRKIYPLFSPAEFVAYMVMIYFVTLRLFLLWRVSVFPPVSNISWYEYGLFQNPMGLVVLLASLVAFWGIIFGVKLLMIKKVKFSVKVWLLRRNRIIWEREICHIKWKGEIRPIHIRLYSLEFYSLRSHFELGRESELPRYNHKKLRSFFAIVFCYALSYVIGKLVRGTWAGILAPILFYFMLTVFIHRTFSKSYVKDGENYGLTAFVFDLFNAMVCSALLFVIDSGYGILFFTYSMVWLLIELYDVLRNTGGKTTWKSYKFWIFFILFVGVLVMVALYYKDIMAVILLGKKWYLFGIVASVLTALFAVSLFGVKMSKKQGLGVLVAVVLAFGLASGGVSLMSFYLNEHAQHTVQRINVHVKEPNKALEEIEDNANQNRYFQAAVNHMIMGEYNDRGQNVQLFGEQGVGYFKMQPHSKIGALWGAQLSDISLVRFVISEHSKLLGPVLIALFAIMLFAGAFVRKHHKFAHYLLIQIPLLLVLQSLLIWMANTQRFVFLGQDFPMVSLNSTLAVFFYVSLVLIWVAVLLYEKATEGRLNSNSARMDILRREGNTEAAMLVVFVSLLVIMPNFIKRKDNFKTFDVTAAMAKVANVLQADRNQKELVAEGESEGDIVAPSHLNDALIAYQTGKNAHRLRSMSNSDLDKFISEFNADVNAEDFFAETNLGLNLWRNFVDHGAAHNSPRNVMYAHLNKSGKVVMAVNRKYFNQSLPAPVQNRWEGSILAHSEEKMSASKTISKGGTKVYILPKEWMHSGKETPLVTGNAHVQGMGQMLSVKPGNACAAAQLLPGMSVSGIDKIGTPARYLARNVKVNGHTEFVYPLGEKFYWARCLAEEVINRKVDVSRNLDLDNKKKQNEEEIKNYQGDLQLSLSMELTSDIYDVFSKSDRKDRDKAVIVADGDGRIVAMVDYKENNSYVLNPNDNKKISRILDSLNMNGLYGSGSERKYFGNTNLMHIEHGPGSTQKPLVWTAVASGIDFDWSNLSIAKYDKNIEVITNKFGSQCFQISKFNGYSFKPANLFLPLCSDENNGNGVDLSGFMTHSSNVYNALMVYLGSWPASEYDALLTVSDEVDRKTLFAETPKGYKRNKKAFQENFPVLLLNQKTIRLNAHPEGSGESWLENSILQENMKEMFGIMPELSLGTSFVESMGGRSFGGYSYVEPSVLLCKDRSKTSSSDEFMEMAIRSTAIGARNVWIVTSLKMAESYGRMVSLNKNYNLTVLDNVDTEYERLDVQKEYLKARSKQFKGMNNVFNGTAGRLKQYESGKVAPYFIYAKTGTIGDDTHDAHRFAVIITNKDLSETSANELKELRYYVLYFTFSKTKTWKDYGDVIDTVVKSPEFVNYMSQSESAIL